MSSAGTVRVTVWQRESPVGSSSDLAGRVKGVYPEVWLVQTMLLVCDGHGPAGAEASEGIVTTFLGKAANDSVLRDCRASGKDAIAKQLEVI